MRYSTVMETMIFNFTIMISILCSLDINYCTFSRSKYTKTSMIEKIVHVVT